MPPIPQHLTVIYEEDKQPTCRCSCGQVFTDADPVKVNEWAASHRGES